MVEDADEEGLFLVGVDGKRSWCVNEAIERVEVIGEESDW